MAFNYEFPYTDPNLYNDDWLLAKMKEMLARLDALDDWKQEYTRAYEDIKKLIEDIEMGIFPQPIRDAFADWMRKNAYSLVGELVKLIFFGITDDGYFVAYIPEGWDDVIFNTTGFDIQIADQDYGHLVLSFLIGGN